MIIPASAKLFGWALGGVIVLSGLGWLNARLTRSVVRDELKVAGIVAGGKKLDSVKVVHDSGYRVDTTTLRTTLTRYDTLHRRLVITDTTKVRAALAAADTAIKACGVVITACEQRVKDRDLIIANRDSLVKELRKPVPVPRLTYDAAGMYDPFKRESILRSGAEFRAFLDFRARAEGEYSDIKGFSLRVGIRKVF